LSPSLVAHAFASAWQAVRLAVWLARCWLAGVPTCLLAAMLAGLLACLLAGWLASWLAYWLTGWLAP